MRLPTYLVRDAHSGLFYFRMKVPAKARPVLGVCAVKRATGARCPRTAVAIASGWAVHYAVAFIAMRGADKAGTS